MVCVTCRSTTCTKTLEILDFNMHSWSPWMGNSYNVWACTGLDHHCTSSSTPTGVSRGVMLRIFRSFSAMWCTAFFSFCAWLFGFAMHHSLNWVLVKLKICSNSHAIIYCCICVEQMILKIPKYIHLSLCNKYNIWLIKTIKCSLVYSKSFLHI